MAEDIRLILPGCSELILKEVQLIAEKKRRDNAIAETTKKKSEFRDKIQNRREIDRYKIRREIAVAVIRESRWLGIRTVLDELSSDNIVNIQKIVIRKLCRQSDNSCLYIAVEEMVNIIKILIKKPWYIFTAIPIFAGIAMVSAFFMMPISLIRFCVDYFVSTPPWRFGDDFMFSLSFIVVLICLPIAGYIHIRILKRTKQKIARFLKIYPKSQYYLSADKLKKEIRNIQDEMYPLRSI